MEKEQTLKLSNLCQGGAEEIFQRDLAKILENIADVNTPSDTVRELTLKIKFAPSLDRRSAMVEFIGSILTTKLSGVAAMSAKIYFTRQGNEMKAYPENPSQTALFGKPATEAAQ